MVERLAEIVLGVCQGGTVELAAAGAQRAAQVDPTHATAATEHHEFTTSSAPPTWPELAAIAAILIFQLHLVGLPIEAFRLE